MVKTETSQNIEASTSNSTRNGGITKPEERNSDSCKYKGVRKRKWGKWVTEIRLPNSRERIWLGSYDSPVKAARAFDAALYCLRGHTAKFNFPDNPPEIPGGRSMTPSQIQAAAVQFANSEARVGHSDHSGSGWSGSGEVSRADSPCPSVSDGTITHVTSEMALDNSFLDQFATMGTDPGSDINSVPDFGYFPGFDDFPNEYYIPPGTMEYGQEDIDEYTTQGSFLWNF